ncbi:glycerol kinase GlpK [Glaciecola sp. 1036]|uniref:glycerol kinase GlpK n=1 Tax=Alteromonadaceae TaxID=72275 RepID=UPI003D05186F
MIEKAILAIDQGTTSSRAILFGLNGERLATFQQEFTQYYPKNAWVEHDPEEIWQTTLTTSKQAVEYAKHQNIKIQCIGITNQRETTLVWHKKTGKPIYNAIVWQDRRTSVDCKGLSSHLETIRNKTGLLLDPYFSATKIDWILKNVDGAKPQADNDELAFGTIDTFLIWRLTSGKSHKTDATNASRTSLYNIFENKWDDDLLTLFDIPKSILPQVCNSADDFGITDANVLGTELPITGVAGDQQAALFGQCCFHPGDFKSTYGTGCFALLNTGETPLLSQHNLLTTIGYQINNKPVYALEGAIFTAGANVQWLRDSLGMLENAQQTKHLAESLDYDHGVYMVPGFVGLGAPHWNPQARASMFGMTRDTTPAHFARAALEAVCYQTNDLLDAMQLDGAKLQNVWVDGGMVANDWMCQFLSDILNKTIYRPAMMESTALGAAYLAGLQFGLYKNLDDVLAHKALESEFTPSITSELRDKLIGNWHKAVQATLDFAKE